MKFKSRQFFLIITALCSACSGFDPQAYVPGLYTATPEPVQETPTFVPSTATIAIFTNVPDATLKVCTNIPGGKLNVRFEAGEKSAVRGYLVEGEIVTPSGERKALDESLWIKLSHPVEGWVNTKFLCEE